MPVLEELKLENFKSYREPAVVQFRQFSSILGLNGTGKSTLLDAIKFAFCFPPYDNMSISGFINEIRNADCNDGRTFVKIQLSSDDRITTFQCTIDYGKETITYLIDDQEVDRQDYLNYLFDFNVNPKANNMFIEQNMIESFFLMTSKERTALFEQLSGSAAHKRDYEKLTKELKKAEAAKKSLLTDKKFFDKRKSVLEDMAEQTKTRDRLSRELTKLELFYHYAQLYEYDSTIEESLKDIEKSKKFIKVTEKLRKSTKDDIAKLKSEIEENMKKLDTYEDKVQQRKGKIEEQINNKLKLDQKHEAAKDKIAKLEENLKQARKIDEARENTIRDLEDQLQQVEEDKEAFAKSQSQTCSIDLADEKYEEYLRLKSEAQMRSSKEIGLLDSIERERESIRDNIEDCNTRKESLSGQIKKCRLECESLNKQIRNIEQNIQETKSAERDMQKKCQELVDESESLKSDAKDLMDQIDTLNAQLGDYKESSWEMKRSRIKQEVLNSLKCNFKGVEDRLKNLCQVSDERYQIAITKLMGNKMDAIVVDTEETAKLCINFLRNKYKGNKNSVIETFLPINYVKTKPLDKALNVVRDSTSKVAVFVMRCTSKEIKKVVHHVLGDVIICETDDEALELSANHKVDCVSLSGTLFKKSGIISGGMASLLEKSRQWTDKDVERLKNEKEKNTDLLKSKRDELRQTLEPLERMTAELAALGKKLERHLKDALEKKLKELERKESELSNLEKSLATFDKDHELEELQNELESKNIEYKEIESKKNEIEDAVFEKFCDDLQIANIREFEQGHVKNLQYRADKQKEYDNLIDKIKNQIKYEKDRDTKAPIEKLESRIESERKNLDKLCKEKDELSALIDKRKSSIGTDQVKSTKKNIDDLKKKLKLEENKLKMMSTDLKEHNSNVLAKKALILNMRAAKHELLVECQINNIKIPLVDGTIDKVVLKCGVNTTERDSTSNSTDVTDESQLKERDVEINYEKLPESAQDDLKKYLKDLESQIATNREELQTLMEHINAENDSEQVDAQLKKIEKDLKEKVKDVKNLKDKLEKVKVERKNLFVDFVTSVQEKIDLILKEIYQNPAAEALIILEDQDEPYLKGITVDCMIPGKKLISMDSISGAEKSICALSLLIAIHQTKPSPCLIFDEIDAAIDNVNMVKLYSYFDKLKESTQIIVISHKKTVNLYADAAINIHVSTVDASSCALHADLHEFKKESGDTLDKTFITDKSVLIQRKRGDIQTSTPQGHDVRLPSIGTSTSTSETRTDSSGQKDSNVRLPSISTTDSTRRVTGESRNSRVHSKSTGSTRSTRSSTLQPRRSSKNGK